MDLGLAMHIIEMWRQNGYFGDPKHSGYIYLFRTGEHLKLGKTQRNVLHRFSGYKTLPKEFLGVCSAEVAAVTEQVMLNRITQAIGPPTRGHEYWMWCPLVAEHIREMLNLRKPMDIVIDLVKRN